MCKRNYLDIKKYEIYDSLLDNGNIDKILSVTENLLNNQIFILDTSYRIIARSKLAKTNNSNIETHNGEEYLMLDIVALMKKSKCIDNIYNTTNSFFYYDDENLIFCAIIINNITVGYIGVLQSNREFQEDDLELTNALSKVLSIQLERENLFVTTSGLNEEYYLMDLLINKIDNIEYIMGRLQNNNFSIKENFIMLSIPFKQKYKDYRHNFALRELINRLKVILKNCISTYYDDKIIFLISNEYNEVITASIKESLLNFLHLNKLKCGISLPFQNLLNIHDFFYQSMCALNLSENVDADNIIYFENHIDNYIFQIYDDPNGNLNKISLSALVHPWLNQIIDFDKENKTDLFLTLKTYFENNRNANITAKKLNIHRSTFFYRFNKIHKILGVTLDDSSNLFTLELSFKILEYKTQTKSSL